MMVRKIAVAALLTVSAVLGSPSFAEDRPARFEITFMPAYNNLLGDGSDYFDNGPGASVGFEVALNRPHEKRTFRCLAVRVTAGYAGFDGAYYDTKLKGAVFGVDGLVLANVGDVIKPYGFFGIGLNNLADEQDIVTGSNGIGFSFGAGSKFFFGDRFIALAELSHQDYTVEGAYAFSPAHVNFVQFRFGIGVRF